LVIQAVGNRSDKSAYQIPIAVQWCFTAFMLAVLPFVPESPWVLVKQGKIDKAKKSLKRLFGNSGDDLDMHLKVIEETLEFEAKLHASTRWIDLFKLVQGTVRLANPYLFNEVYIAMLFRGTDQRRTWIVMLLYLCQQVTGVQFVLGYSTYFFELAGFAPTKAFALGVGTLSLAVGIRWNWPITGKFGSNHARFLLSLYIPSSSATLRGFSLPTQPEGETSSLPAPMPARSTVSSSASYHSSRTTDKRFGLWQSSRCCTCSPFSLDCQ
jgi:hypothetical protein